MESARQRFEWLQYRHLTLSLKVSVHVRRPFGAAFSDLTLLGSRKGIRPVKNWVVVICLQRGADLHMAHLMPLPLTVCCFSKIQIGFTFRVPAHPGSPGQRAVKRVCVCVVHNTLTIFSPKFMALYSWNLIVSVFPELRHILSLVI